MYLSLNFRFPGGEMGAMGRDAGGGLMSRDTAAMLAGNPPNSAFKHPGLPALPEPKVSDPLPPISSLRTDGQINTSNSSRLPAIHKPMVQSPHTNQAVPTSQFTSSGHHHHHHPHLHPVPPPPHHNPVAVAAAAAAAAQIHHHHHHHPSFPPPTTSQQHVIHQPAPPTSFCPQPPPPPNPAAHPAFAAYPLSSWPMSHPAMQQMMSSDGGFMAQYLNSCDPLARAALMELTRMGHYPLGKKLFGCPQCRYITDRKNNLKRHVATMHQDCDKVLECCGIFFKNKASLRDHVLIFHSNGYMCRFCGRNFCRKALLKRHLTVHSGQKDFLCDQCDYATSHKSNLERHRKVHERQGETSDEDESGELSPRNRSTDTDLSSPGSTKILADKPMDLPSPTSPSAHHQLPSHHHPFPHHHRLYADHMRHFEHLQHQHMLAAASIHNSNTNIRLQQHHHFQSQQGFIEGKTSSSNLKSVTNLTPKENGIPPPPSYDHHQHNNNKTAALKSMGDNIRVNRVENSSSHNNNNNTSLSQPSALKVAEKMGLTTADNENNCLIDLDDDFDLNNMQINVVDM